MSTLPEQHKALLRAVGESMRDKLKDVDAAQALERGRLETVIKALASRLERAELMASAPTVPPVVRNEVAVPSVVVKNDVGVPEVHVQNNIPMPEFTVPSAPVAPITVVVDMAPVATMLGAIEAVMKAQAAALQTSLELQTRRLEELLMAMRELPVPVVESRPIVQVPPAQVHVETPVVVKPPSSVREKRVYRIVHDDGTESVVSEE